MKKFTIAIVVIILVVIAVIVGIDQKAKAPAPSTNTPTSTNTTTNTKSPSTSTNNLTASTTTMGLLTDPISNAKSRITKKPFGIKVSPGNSPVSPERFTGYHTGVDFETTPAEQNTDVPIYAACNGTLLLKEWATGYGGVAVQSCRLNGQSVTIIYGHLRLASIASTVGSQLSAGQQIAVLGTGYSQETDGERKNLHFGVHIGTSINILGYVSTQSQLSGWLDPAKYLPN